MMKTRAFDPIEARWRTDYVVMPDGNVRQLTYNSNYAMTLWSIVNWKLSRFTGLLDIEENEVYEHHIVENEFGVRYVVAWDQENCRFKAKQPIKPKETFHDILKRSYNYPFDDHFVTYVKVIGDIFQNPELLEVE
jgi:uncharacterized phage protein (TIGR01671 family)